MTFDLPVGGANLTMPFNHSFVLKTGNPKRDKINPNKLGMVKVVQADGAFIDDLFDFFARYVQKVHSDEFIRNTMKVNQGTSFIDIIGPNDIPYVIAIFKNSKDMWDQDIQMQESGQAAMGNPEKRNQYSQAGVVRSVFKVRPCGIRMA